MFEELTVPRHNHDGINSDFIKMPDRNLTKKAVQKGVTAAVGSTQATGVQIVRDIVEISVCANAGDSLTMPHAMPGLQVVIINHGANSADIFPAVGDQINEAAVNTALALPADDTMICYAYDDINFECLILSR